MSPDSIKRIGHRGAAGFAPENTLAAIEAGLILGVDFVEIDVQRTADGALVLMHDKRVDRTTNGTGDVASLTLAQLRTLDAGDGERVPTLAEALAKVSGRAGVMVELIAAGTAAAVQAEVLASGFSEPVIYASFLHAELLGLRDRQPAAKTLALLEGVPLAGASFARDAGATYAGLGIDSLTREFVQTLRAGGLRVFVYTVNDPRDIARVRSWGVDGIITDYPDRVA